jgi:protein tyrosine phosphatase (PTP) superfamily phosphohydrolase (DUF442 family)
LFSPRCRAVAAGRISDFGFRISLGLLLSTLCFGVCLASGRGLPSREGIVNFGQVNDQLYRGAQPDALALQNLKHLGVKLIINLRLPRDSWQSEEAEARANGILYTNVPLRGLGRPTDQQVGKVLALIESAPGPVFIHCEHGCDRTGTIIACYRIRHEHWSLDSALREARQYGMSWLERGMKSYVLAFAKKASDRSRETGQTPEDRQQRVEAAP